MEIESRGIASGRDRPQSSMLERQNTLVSVQWKAATAPTTENSCWQFTKASCFNLFNCFGLAESCSRRTQGQEVPNREHCTTVESCMLLSGVIAPGEWFYNYISARRSLACSFEKPPLGDDVDDLAGLL